MSGADSVCSLRFSARAVEGAPRAVEGGRRAVALAAVLVAGSGCSGEGQRGLELDAGGEPDASSDSGTDVPPDAEVCSGEPDASGEGCAKLAVEGFLNECVQITSYLLSPLAAVVGTEVDLSAFADDRENDPVSYSWTAPHGTFSRPDWPFTKYRCDTVGEIMIKLTVSDHPECLSSVDFPVVCLAE